jgi:hypothetical protein
LLRQQEGDSCGDADGGKEGVGASVMAHGDAAPVLETAEGILDAVAIIATVVAFPSGVQFSPKLH